MESLPADDQPPHETLVPGALDDAVASIGEMSMDNPAAVALVFFGALDERAPNVAVLRRVVTPESWSAWGGFREVARATAGMSIGTVPKFAVGSDDVAYITGVADPGGAVMRVDAEADMIIDAPFVISLQRRPDLGGEWRVHQVGQYVRPEEMPPVRP